MEKVQQDGESGDYNSGLLTMLLLDLKYFEGMAQCFLKIFSIYLGFPNMHQDLKGVTFKLL